MKRNKPLFTSLLVASLVTLSSAALGEEVFAADSVTAAVVPSTVERPALGAAQRALDAHLNFWTATDPAHYPYESLLTEEAVYEFPYAPVASRRVEGKSAIADYLRAAAHDITDWKFSDVRLFSTLEPNVFFASFNATATVRETGNLYRQHYLVRLTLNGDKIANLLVLWDQSARAAAFAKVQSQ